ncbi:exported hypothetical protein [Candidatus Sulfopaludibacter sp. SbA6]|nr:exported hypothetical protein [Candidatus Sulfopaludibacter sp. SbA6]
MHLHVESCVKLFVIGTLIAAMSGLANAAPPEILTVRQTLPQEVYQQIRLGLLAPTEVERTVAVGRYEKLELRVELRATYQNPYDPDDLDLWAEFAAPSGKVWKIWGFYNPTSPSALWMVRFAPTETGTWRYVVKVRDKEGTAESKPREVSVVESKHHGFVRIADNKRYLQFTDGSPFYGVGMWYNDGYELFGRGSITEEGLDSLKQHGANFISFYHSPLETMGTGLGRYDENRAGRLDQVFEWCEQRDMFVSWNIWFHSNFSEAVWGGGNARYGNNPYRLVASADKFFSSEEAGGYLMKVYRYMVARWGYSRALYLWFVVDEINGTEGWLKGGSEAGEQWCQKVHNWLKESDPYGRPTTGTQSGGIKQWWPGGYQIFDIAAREIYEAQGHPIPKSGKPDLIGENPVKYSYLNYARQTEDLWSGFNKPALIGECGWDHTYYEPGMPGYLAMYHNALWVTLANGLSATPFWWSNGSYINDAVVTRTMSYFSRFVRDINFAAGEWKPLVLNVSDGNGWAMQGDKMTFGWVVNPVSGVANETFSVSGLEDDDYDVYLYRTWRGEYLPAISAASTGGTLTVKIPELLPRGGRAQNIGDDVAIKIVKKGVSLGVPIGPLGPR